MDLIEREQARLAAAVRRLPGRQLGRTVQEGWSAADTIRGIAAHDVYHAGQIQLLKALKG